MSSSSSSRTMITLKSCDGQGFEVDISVASESQTIKKVMEDDDFEKNITIPLPNVRGQILSKVIEYCKKHVEAAAEDNMLKDWDAGFVKVDIDTLFDLALAAKYLRIEGLTDLTCQTIADMIKGKTPDQIRKTLNIENDFTPEEEAEIQKENAWAFQ